MKKIIFLLIFTEIVFLLDGLGSTSKFGIEVAKYKSQISELPQYFSYNENTNKYSWNTPIQLPDSNLSIQIEHLVIANNTDISMIPEITSHRFLMSLIAFKDGSYKDIDSIKIENSVNNQVLSSCAYYTYTRAKDKTHRWDIQKVPNPNHLAKHNNIEAIAAIYPFPKYVPYNILGIRKGLFKDAKQTIKIVYWKEEGKEDEI